MKFFDKFVFRVFLMESEGGGVDLENKNVYNCMKLNFLY